MFWSMWCFKRFGRFECFGRCGHFGCFERFERFKRSGCFRCSSGLTVWTLGVVRVLNVWACCVVWAL